MCNTHLLFGKEGPCLVHTITGDLLRALEGPAYCLCPRLISVSSEGHCIIYYERGHFCNFSINGKLLAQMEIKDSTRVNRLYRDTLQKMKMQINEFELYLILIKCFNVHNFKARLQSSFDLF